MKIPGPDHPITLEPATARWRARFAGQVIADTAGAIIVRETDLPPRVYFPRADAAMDHMQRTERSTHCPYKGDAAYYTVLADGLIAENAVWTYEEPFPAMQAIIGMLSFYPDKVDVYEGDDEAANPRHDEDVRIADVVQHTDSGAGTSQREHWVETPATPDDGGPR